ncbi:hypothetical protein IIC38_03925 [candidate division KSB1 bacterium]|nr:hypothetical protein [candidate division KSB1 bacterium]
MTRKFIPAILLLLLGTSSLFAQNHKFSGLVYADAYWVAANHNSNYENQNGFWFRRIYFTYDNQLSDAFSTRLRFEMNSPGDFSTKSKLNPFVKDAYLKWNLGQHDIYVGISTSPTFAFLESVWGYRSVEKTLADLHKFGSSRDTGIAFKGSLDQNKRFQYHAMLANGNGTSSETNKEKKIMLAFAIELVKNLFVEGYSDWNGMPDGKDRYTKQGFIAYKTSTFRIGAQFLHQTRKQGDGLDSQKIRWGSVFTAAKLGEKVWGFARVDRGFDPNPSGESLSYLPFSDQAKSKLIIAGLDFSVEENVHIMPNFELVNYDVDEGEAPSTDFIPRLTFYYTW